MAQYQFMTVERFMERLEQQARDDVTRLLDSARSKLTLDDDMELGIEDALECMRAHAEEDKDIATIANGLDILLNAPVQYIYSEEDPEKIIGVSRMAVDGDHQIYVVKHLIIDGVVYHQNIKGEKFGVIDPATLDFSESLSMVQSIPRRVTVVQEGGQIETMQGDHLESIARTTRESLLFEGLHRYEDGKELPANAKIVTNANGDCFNTIGDNYAPKHGGGPNKGHFWKFEDLRGMGFAIEHLEGSTDENPTTFLVKNMNPIKFMQINEPFALMDAAGAIRDFKAGDFIRPDPAALAADFFYNAWEAAPVAQIVAPKLQQ